MKLIKHFDAFLKNKVNLGDSRIASLDARVTAVENFLSSGTDSIATNFIELIPQGSYAQGTIINPVAANDEFDADVLLDMNEVDGWEAEDYVEELYKVFRNNSTYRDMVRRRTRCVVVDYAGDFHIDVVPYLTRHDERFITNRSENSFELTNPEGFNEWLGEQNQLTSGRLVKALRLMKYIRDYKNNFTIPSVILSILVGNQVSSTQLLADPDHYQDLPTAFRNLLADLNDYLQAHPTMPSIDDPSCATDNFNHRWDQEKYANFRAWIKTYSDWADDAYSEEDVEQSHVKWRRLFGDKFGTYATTAAKASESHKGLANVQDTEDHAHEKFTAVALNPAYNVRLRARTVRCDGFSTYDLPTRGNKVAKNRQVTFSVVSCNVPEPYEIWWKVRNTGPEAIARNMIRGQITPDGGNRRQTEPTSFRGNHYVEVYVVKDGVLVAKAHQRVFIT